jgi:hypothetical protein
LHLNRHYVAFALVAFSFPTLIRAVSSAPGRYSYKTTMAAFK